MMGRNLRDTPSEETKSTGILSKCSKSSLIDKVQPDSLAVIQINQEVEVALRVGIEPAIGLEEVGPQHRPRGKKGPQCTQLCGVQRHKPKIKKDLLAGFQTFFEKRRQPYRTTSVLGTDTVKLCWFQFLAG